MANSKNHLSLTVLRLFAALTALLSIIQAILGFILMGGGNAGLHHILGMVAFATSLVAALASVVWMRPSGNKGMMFHALTVAAMALVQVGIGEAGLAAGSLQIVHMTIGVAFLVAAVALVTLSVRKPLGSRA